VTDAVRDQEGWPVKAEWFAGRLKEVRKAAGLTQQQLADKAALAVGVVRKLEQGDNGPTWDTVLKLSQALGVDCTAFAQEPADTEPPGPGRPPKAAVETPPAKAKKKPRGKQK
jgi:transcriptional regulator with XRE-family HTH domain